MSNLNEFKLNTKYVIKESSYSTHKACKGCIGEFVHAYSTDSDCLSFLGDKTKCFLRCDVNRCFDVGSSIFRNCIIIEERVLVTGFLEISDGL